jgi:hypothetical protein
MKIIQLTNGTSCCISEIDFERISTCSWYQRTGRYSKTSYAATAMRINGGNPKFVYMHRFILDLTDLSLVVDHIDGNGLNNQRNNLRICTRSDNMKNVKPHGTSKYMGVCKHLSGYWLAKINIDGKQKHIGLFTNEKDAALAYNEAAIATGNVFYNLNDIAV